MGANGLLSGAGSVIADLQFSLFKAVQNKDLSLAQEINDKIFPLAQTFYSPPFLDMHNRMKEALVLLGKLEQAIVRPPLMKLSDKEINNIKLALIKSNMLN
jgi:4-hydroxy-tetrahydrodipicolinate synthase